VFNVRPGQGGSRWHGNQLPKVEVLLHRTKRKVRKQDDEASADRHTTSNLSGMLVRVVHAAEQKVQLLELQLAKANKEKHDQSW
jgi:hypothetical protein